MRLIVTRPEEDATNLIAKLKARGVGGIASPLIRIEFLEGTSIPTEDWQAILVTSANSVRALKALDLVEELATTPVLAVGPASTKAAREAGFESVASADGDLPALTKLALEQLNPEAGPVLYPSGVTISGDLRGLLTEAGFECMRVPLYDAVRTEVLPSEVLDALNRKELDGVVLYSPRTARIWAECVRNGNISDKAARLFHWCLSAAVADALIDSWPDVDVPQNIQIAPEPNEASLIEAICPSNGR